MKVLLTGGHVTPALEVIDEIPRNNQIVFVGRKKTYHTDENNSFEYEAVSKIPYVRFIDLKTGRFSRLISINSMIELMKIPLGFLRAWQIVRKEKPDVILTFGGYLALPVAVAGWLQNIDVYTHEQTLRPGIANRIIGYFARAIFVSFRESRSYFRGNVIVTGNPIRKAIFKADSTSIKIDSKKPVVLILGGSLGSHSINLKIEEILAELTKVCTVVHQTGSVVEFGDYDRLKEKKRLSYIPLSHLTDENIGFAYNRADLVVCRVGANTFFELAALGKPALMIPLPWSAYNEQYAHAKLYKEAGCGEIFDQSHSSYELLNVIKSMISRLDYYSSNSSIIKKYYEKDATKTILKTVLEK